MSDPGDPPDPFGHDECGNCRFFRPENYDTDDTGALKNYDSTGTCRRHPPTIAGIEDDVDEFKLPYKRPLTMFPAVDGEFDWCGEFEPRPVPLRWAE